MYNVTDNYRELIKSPVRYTGLNGAVRLKDGTTIQLNDGNVDSGSLQIINKLNRRGDFRPGGVYSSEMSIGLKGFDGKTSDLDGAILRLNFLIYPDASMSASNSETVPLGRFYVDGSTIKRRRDKVTLCANDALVLFDIPASERSGTFYDLVEAACAAAGVGFGMTKDDFEKLPNATLSASTNAARIQTEHDLLMYVGMATASFARIRREDNKLEFKPLSCEKDEKNMIIPVREIAGDIRFTTDFSDDTTRISKVFTRRNGSVVSSSLTVTPGGSEKLTMLELDDNPLFSELSDTDLISAMNNELSQLYQCLNRAFDASFTGDPALDVGDYVRLRGGAIDTDRGYATGMITSQIWRYRGQHTIKCSLPSSMTSTGSTSAATVAAYTFDTPSDQYRLQPKSQLEKRMDAIEAAGSGVKTAEKLVSPSGESWAEMLDSNSRGNGGGIWFGENGNRWAYLSQYNGGLNLGNTGTAQIYLDGAAQTISIENYQNHIRMGLGYDIEICHSSGSHFRVNNGAMFDITPESIELVGGSLYNPLVIRRTDSGFKISRGSCTLEAKPDGLYYNGTKIGG